MVNVLAIGATTLERDVVYSDDQKLMEVEVRDVVQCPKPRSCNICARFSKPRDCNVCLCAV